VRGLSGLQGMYPVAFEDVWGAGACDISWPFDVETACATEGGYVLLTAEDRAKSANAYDQIGLTIAAYEASPEVNAFSSKYDYVLKDMATLTKEERKGFALFHGKGMCFRCHTVTGPQPLLTDFTFDNLGMPKNPDNPFYDRDPDFVDLGLGGFLMNAGYDPRYTSLRWASSKSRLCATSISAPLQDP